MSHDITFELADETATLNAGASLADSLSAGLTIYLHGDLGAGKTTFVRGLLHALGHTGKVKSPTYTLVEPYVIDALNVYHFDLYRFIDPEEWDAAGFRDYFNPESISLVEWPEKAGDLLPQADIDIRLIPKNAGREINLFANTETGKKCLNDFVLR
ncbi:MAG TPA: tRNA (adenosine(37)-N6)-threonylcarbamoyltransferase complex ATPase subunit type 1 TsaE [Methylophilaceae bacterium]|nr:tRNA (adenosine(37)-N6)-threonylcarbamoyltransferase complex ATPase subunit type 1 TsaE [Methylophilaceae bacterium]